MLLVILLGTASIVLGEVVMPSSTTTFSVSMVPQVAKLAHCLEGY